MKLQQAEKENMLYQNCPNGLKAEGKTRLN